MILLWTTPIPEIYSLVQYQRTTDLTLDPSNRINLCAGDALVQLKDDGTLLSTAAHSQTRFFGLKYCPDGGLILTGDTDSGSTFQGVGYSEPFPPRSVTFVGKLRPDFSFTESPNSITITDYIGNDQDVVIPSHIYGKPVTKIGAYAFYSKLTTPCSITFPPTLEFIDEWAFFGCHGLTEISFPNTLTHIGPAAFKGCSGLSSIQFPSGITRIGNSSFAQCTGLREIILSPELTEIEPFSFYQCSSIETIIIPAKVAQIGGSAFRDCTLLSSATFLGNAPSSFGTRVFENPADGFRINYRLGASGFTSPTWNSIPTLTFRQGDHDGDTNVDLFLQSPTTGIISVQHFNGSGNAIDSAQTINAGTHPCQLITITHADTDLINDYIVRKLDGSNSYEVRLRDANDNVTAIRSYNPGGADWRLVGVYDQDFDGYSDLLWQNASTGQTILWWLNATGAKDSSAVLAVSMADYRIAAVGDMNADGLMDLLWQKVSDNTTDLIAWYLDASGSRTSLKVIGTVTGGYRCVGLADYNSDNVNDIVWQRVSTGQAVVWYMSPNGTHTGTKVLSAGDPDQLVANWQWDLSLPAVHQDEDGDGKADILWQHGTNGHSTIWRMNGAWERGSYATVAAANNAPGKLIALADMDADGVNDYVWCRQVSGNNVVTIWLMNADRTLKSQKVVTPAVPTTYTLAGAGDMNSDGMADLLWQQSSNGQLIVWHMDGAGNRQSYSILLASMNGYRVQAVSDMNRDGNADLIWQRQSGGNTQTSIWYMDGAGTRASFRTVNSVPQDWKLGCVGDYNGDGNADMMWFNTSTKQAVGWELDANNARTGTVVVAKNMGDYSIAGL